MTMADKISRLERDLAAAERDLIEARTLLNDERKHHREQLDALATDNFPFDWHRASDKYGQPIYIAGNYTNDKGFSLELYANDGGNIIGGVVMDREDSDEMAVFGMVAAHVFEL
jgi:hypothetical protein